jgi:cardiolipin synthase
VFLQKNSDRLLTISNFLSVSRIILAPIIAVGVYYRWWTFTFILFVVASVTDVLDGFVARLFNEQTRLGKMLDPVADKVFLLFCFGSLVVFEAPAFYIPSWFFVIEIIREVTILLGAYFLLVTHENFEIKPTIFGKLTTFFQLVFISWLFVCRFFSFNPVKTFNVLLILLVIFSFLSWIHYIKKASVFFMKWGQRNASS